MNAPNLLKFDQAAKNLERLSGPNGLLGSLEKMLGGVETQLRNYAEIHRAVVKRLVPAVRRELAVCYSQSGLRQVSKQGKGNLYKAAVTQALIDATPKGIYVHFGSGFDASVYARGGAFQYGAVRGPREKKMVRDTVTGGPIRHGDVAGSTRVTSVLGERAKRSIKKAVFSGKKLTKRQASSLSNGIDGEANRARFNAKLAAGTLTKEDKKSRGNIDRRGVKLGEVTVVRPKPFYTLSSGQKKALEDLYIKAWQEEATKLLQRFKMKRAS